MTINERQRNLKICDNPQKHHRESQIKTRQGKSYKIKKNHEIKQSVNIHLNQSKSEINENHNTSERIVAHQQKSSRVRPYKKRIANNQQL